MNAECIRINTSSSYWVHAHVYREGIKEVNVRPEGLVVSFDDARPDFLVTWDEAIRDALENPPLDEVKQGASPTLGGGPSSQP